MQALVNLATTKKWNKAFTNILRENDRTVWGNWTLNPTVIAGSVGIVDTETGEFTPLGTVPGAEIIPLLAGQDWFVESTGVRRTESQVDFKGGYTDPSTGLTVDVGTQVNWSFSEESALSSNAHVSGRTVVNDLPDLVASQYEWLYEKAKKAGFATENGIVQGFGIITQTWDCAGAVNLGSLEKDSSFGLTGSVDGSAAMTGSAPVKAGIKGSYKETKATKAFERHMYPSEKDTAPTSDVAISYNFASFDGRVLLPRWASPMTGLTIVFTSGGSFVSRCTIRYKRPDGKTYEDKVSFTAGLTRTLTAPLDATDMNIEIDLAAGDTFRFKFDRPTAEWLLGQLKFEIGGWWPSGGWVKWST
jgi:hypothetical protein